MPDDYIRKYYCRKCGTQVVVDERWSVGSYQTDLCRSCEDAVDRGSYNTGPGPGSGCLGLLLVLVLAMLGMILAAVQ